MRTIMLAAAVLAGVGQTGILYAHTQNGSLGAVATATDYYQVTCSNDGNGPPRSLIAQVKDLAPVAPPRVSVQVAKGAVSRSAIDAVDGNAAFSPLVRVAGGAGVYHVYIRKSAAGSEIYTLSFHCKTAADGSGAHTGTVIVIKQNQ
jgi:hypothetical protein